MSYLSENTLCPRAGRINTATPFYKTGKENCSLRLGEVCTAHPVHAGKRRSRVDAGPATTYLQTLRTIRKKYVDTVL